jgi:hypothetical protein
MLPACGPSRNTPLGHTFWYVPLILLGLQSFAVTAVGRRTDRTGVATIAGVALAATLATVAGIVIFLGFFAAGNCGE